MADAPILGGTTKVTLDDAAFGARFNGPLVHESVRAELAARRQGTHATKTRGAPRGPPPHKARGGGRRRRHKAVAPEGDRPCPRRLVALADLDRRWHGL